MTAATETQSLAIAQFDVVGVPADFDEDAFRAQLGDAVAAFPVKRGYGDRPCVLQVRGAACRPALVGFNRCDLDG